MITYYTLSRLAEDRQWFLSHSRTVPAECFTMLHSKRARSPMVAVDCDDDDDEMQLLVGSHVPPRVEPTAVTVDLTQLHLTSKSALAETIETVFEPLCRSTIRYTPDLLDAFAPFMSDREETRLRDEPIPVIITAWGPAPALRVGGGDLRNYQQTGVDFLIDGFRSGISRILADDMGLGKTAQICAALETIKHNVGVGGPHLIIAPLSVLTSWHRELTRWAPSLHVIKVQGDHATRRALHDAVRGSQAVVLTNPAAFCNDRSFFTSRPWLTVVFDEAHQLRGGDTNVVRYARKLNAAWRVAVSGTPVSNSPVEVWSLMQFLFPFIGKHVRATRDLNDAAQEASAVLEHIMLRRTKQQVELELPPRIDEAPVMLDATPAQRAIYDQVIQERKDFSGREVSFVVMQLRKACNHPHMFTILDCTRDAATGRRLLSAADETPHRPGETPGVLRLHASGVGITEHDLVSLSAKMIYLDGMLASLQRDSDRVLIFSNFSSQLDLLEGFCRLRSYRYERLDGSTSPVERELSTMRFCHPKSKSFIFLLSTTAGGVGLTLTAANHVILFDAHFNPQMDRQAADRAHRLGQTRTVHVHRLGLRNTIEERISLISRSKAALGDWIVNGREPEKDCHVKHDADLTDVLKQLVKLEQQRGLVTSPAANDEDSLASDVEGRRILESLNLCRTRAAATSPTCRDVDVLPAGSNDKSLAECYVCLGANPNVFCPLCQAWYHTRCLGDRPGNISARHWSCPHHSCRTCEQRLSDEIFRCTSCTRSFCFDCLDPKLLSDLNAEGDFVAISQSPPCGTSTSRPLCAFSPRTFFFLCHTCDHCLSDSDPPSQLPSDGEEESDSDNDCQVQSNHSPVSNGTD
mgnify:FL=1